jgi:hypothetical protein
MTLSRLHRKARLDHGDMKDIAEETGYDISYVSLVISGRRRNDDIERVAARKMGVAREQAFRPREKKSA